MYLPSRLPPVTLRYPLEKADKYMPESFDIVPGIGIGGEHPLLVVAGPCVIENTQMALETALALKETVAEAAAGFVFKASFDKANRTALDSPRGPGLDEGLKMLARVRNDVGVPVLTDFHVPEQAAVVAEVTDVLQVPAFLCRQTDMLVAAGETGKAVNIKKGQFLAPELMRFAAEKVETRGNHRVILTERGSFFGYGDLVVDMRSLPVMRSLGYPVLFDATHSVQRPGGKGNASGGNREMVRYLLRAACAAGVDGIFLETHPEPEKALSDGANMVPLAEIPSLIREAVKIHALRRRLENG